MSTEPPKDARACPRCGAVAAYSADAIVPGDPMAPRESRRGIAQRRPAWTCVSCGHLEPDERRLTRRVQRQGA